MSDRPGEPVTGAEPVAAERVDSGQCAFDCDNDAEYLVEWRMDGGGRRRRFRHLTCHSCQELARIYVVANELLDVEVSDVARDAQSVGGDGT